MATKLMAGKRGLIMGLANDKSIAWGIAKALHDAGAELARLVDHAGGEEVEIGGGADIRLAGECHHLAGDRAGKGVERVVVGFQETPAGAGIVGEGAAGLVAETGALALVERNVLFGAQIEAEIVAVGRGLDGARRLGERGRRQYRRQDQAKKKSKIADSAHRHAILLCGWRPRPIHQPLPVVVNRASAPILPFDRVSLPTPPW